MGGTEEPRHRSEVVVPNDLDGERADRIVATVLGISRSVARSLFSDGEVTSAAGPVGPAARLSAGTTLSVPESDAADVLQPADVAFGVAYEDDALIIVDKPAGLVVHPGAGHRHDTLASGLVYRYPELDGLGESRRWGLVHRLDRDTSGLLMVARTAAAHEALQTALRRREIGRTYLAMAVGEFDSATGTIEAPMGRDPAHPTRMAIQRGGRDARTHYRRLAVWPGVTLLEVTLDTGRTHQIRVHLASIDAPLVGDAVYGRPGGEVADAGRVWLHARRLELTHPVTGAAMAVTAPLPSDLADALQRLGAPARGRVPALEA